MSTAIYAKLLTNRRALDRAEAGRASTIRQQDQIPVDVVIDDLSCGGCRVSGDLGLAVDDRVTIGLPGIGACPAKVIWTKDGSTGLEFHRALTGHDVDIACETNTLIDGHFGLVHAGPPPPLDRDDGVDDADERLSPRRRLGIIIAAAICAWCITLLAVWLVIRLI